MATNPQHEPTMEEILASIRKIISEDVDEPAPVEASSDIAMAKTTISADNDVYELSEAEVIEETAEPSVSAPQETARVMQLPSQRQESETPFHGTQESPMAAPADKAASNDTRSEEGFFSDSTRRAMHDTFVRLDERKEEPAKMPEPPKPASEGSSVQAVFEHAIRERFSPVVSTYLSAHADEIVERMKPLVREWMDEHFPAILEGVVRNEVERAVKASGASKARR